MIADVSLRQVAPENGPDKKNQNSDVNFQRLTFPYY